MNARSLRLFSSNDPGSRWLRNAVIGAHEKLAEYLTTTLEAIAAGHPANRIEDLMPWAFSPASS